MSKIFLAEACLALLKLGVLLLVRESPFWVHFAFLGADIAGIQSMIRQAADASKQTTAQMVGGVMHMPVQPAVQYVAPGPDFDSGFVSDDVVIVPVQPIAVPVASAPPAFDAETGRPLMPAFDSETGAPLK